VNFRKYWDQRFEVEDKYEWLTSFEDIEADILEFLSPSHKILVIGCGTSSFSFDLYSRGYRNIVSIDYSAVVIEKLKSQHSNTEPEMEWICMDMTDLRFAGSSFDVVIDKAAMDAIMVDEGDPWSPDDSVRNKAHKICEGVSRVLIEDGVFLQVSFMQPHFRRWYLLSETREEPSHRTTYSSSYRWSISHKALSRPDSEVASMENFLYVCQKSDSAQDSNSKSEVT